MLGIHAVLSFSIQPFPISHFIFTQTDIHISNNLFDAYIEQIADANSQNGYGLYNIVYLLSTIQKVTANQIMKENRYDWVKPSTNIIIQFTWNRFWVFVHSLYRLLKHFVNIANVFDIIIPRRYRDFLSNNQWGQRDEWNTKTNTKCFHVQCPSFYRWDYIEVGIIRPGLERSRNDISSKEKHMKIKKKN